MAIEVALSPGQVVSLIPALTTLAQANGDSFALPGLACQLSWQTIFATTPDAVSIKIQGSLDNTNWVTLDTSTVVTGDLKTLIISAPFIRAQIESATNGSTVMVLGIAKIVY